MKSLNDLETPAAVVDLDRFERNLDRAAEYATRHGIALRPHTKTHKSSWIAAEQVRRGAAGVTCATPREAEVMARVSDDILLAYPPVGKAKADRVAALPREARVIVALDSAEAIDEMERAAAAAARRVGVYVEIDMGMHRAGLAPERAAALCRLALDLPGLELDGIFTFRSTAFAGAAGRAAELIEAVLAEQITALAEQGRDQLAAADAFGALRSWLAAIIAHGMTYRGLAAEVMNSALSSELLSDLHGQLFEVGAALLDRAFQAGVIVAVDETDVLGLAGGIAWAARDDAAQADRLLSLLMNGLRQP